MSGCIENEPILSEVIIANNVYDNETCALRVTIDGMIEGPQGLAGPQGFPGMDGYDGDQGPQGSVGGYGPQGLQGFVGPQGGDSDVPGPQGFQGIVGPQGVPGPPGRLIPISIPKTSVSREEIMALIAQYLKENYDDNHPVIKVTYTEHVGCPTSKGAISISDEDNVKLLNSIRKPSTVQHCGCGQTYVPPPPKPVQRGVITTEDGRKFYV